MRDQVQDIVDLQRDLSVAKEKITKYESQLTTREWLISRDEIEVMSDKCLGEGFIWREAPKPKCLPGLVSPIKV